MWKGEFAGYEQFLLFPRCFQKACFQGVSKGVIVWEWVNSLPDYKILNLSMFKAFADDKLIVTKKSKLVFGRIQNNAGENAGYQLFSFFLNVFKSFLYHTLQTFIVPAKTAFFKTLQEKEKMLVTSIFSFSCNVFYPSPKQFLCPRKINVFWGILAWHSGPAFG